MFEQSILAGHPTGGRWSFLASLASQSLLVALAVLLPLIYTSHLSLMQTASPLTLPLPPPAAAPPAQTQKRPATTNPTPRTPAFTAPARIPPRAAIIVDAPSAPVIAASGTGVPGGIGAATGDPFGLLSKAAPPPPAKTETRAETAPAKPLRVGSGVQEAKLLRRVVPAYPPLARQARISGTVELVGVIARDGTIEDLHVVSGHPLLVKAALDAVRQWIYKPTLLNGEPVEVICPIDVHFRLN